MNNIFLNNDPLLYDTKYQRPSEIQQPYNIYQIPQQQFQTVDWVGILDTEMKELDGGIAEELTNNTEYKLLSEQLQAVIQGEIMNLVRAKLNMNPQIVDNIKRQRELIKQVTHSVKETERRNMNELKDYMNNYSSMTFDEYKKIKDKS